MTLLLGVGVAHAATVSYSATIPTQDAPFDSSFALTKFDTSLGTLTGVTLVLNTTSNADIEILNSTSTSQAYTNATTSITLTASGPGGTSVVSTAIAGPLSGNAAANQTTTISGVAGSGSSTVNLDPSSFSFYSGVGTAALTFSASAGDAASGGQAGRGVFFGGGGSVGGIATVIYTYAVPSVAPEPGSLPLLVGGAALPVLGMLIRRRKMA